MKKLLAVLAIIAVALYSVSSVTASTGTSITIYPSSQYSSPGKTVEYTITVHNYDSKSKSVALEVESGNCNSSWFEWTGKGVYVRARSLNSLTMKVTPSMNATEGRYHWNVATTSASASATIEVQGYDYASEIHVEGEGVFVIDKDVSSFSEFDAEHQFSVSLDKYYAFSGEIDGFVSDEYLIEGAQGDNPNFEQKSAVGFYRAKASSDFLYGSEKLHSPFPFGGTGTTIMEQYEVNWMDLRLEDVNLHSTGNQRYKTELATINEFDGHFLLDAKQSVPGYTQIDIRNEFFGNLTVCKHLIFRRPEKSIFAP